MQYKKLLIVEDDSDYSNLFHKSIPLYAQKKGQQDNVGVDLALDKSSALEKIAQNNYDVIFTDGCLEGNNHGDFDDWSGVEIARAGKEKGAYIVGVSGEPEKFGKLAGNALDINYKKPWQILTLWYIIENQPTEEIFNEYKKRKTDE
ncbi:MAG: hypothetical protein U9R34_07205 [Nanoarchaeota archaeon]|nr:hypothetical protein [Nanoarchaeota archaeon]